ncbi:MAG: hypothetical protein K0V04_27305 [Deltaproteobacteria bacterium]|nr:hypothetical protein [Deltaproteobacteria bacterium]
MQLGRVLGLAVLSLACGESGRESPRAASVVGSPPPQPPDLRRCVPPPTIDASPESIAEAVALLNALPPPVTVACFIESLERPLQVFASASPFSAQPSSTLDSPRIFIRNGPLTMTVVPDGMGAGLLEFGEQAGPGRTRKGEVELPPAGTLAWSAPYDRVQVDDTTTCGTCHDDEAADGSGFVSEVLHPSPMFDVSLAQLRQAATDCDRGRDAQRCDLLAALFDHGDVQPAMLPRGGRICDH